MPPKTPKGAPGAQPEPTLKVMGNFFVPEMRTIVAMLELNGVPHQVDFYDILKQEGKKSYVGFNPSETVPTIIDGTQTILADPPTLIKLICKTKVTNDKLYPLSDMDQDKRKAIDKYLDFIQLVFKRTTKMLTKQMFQQRLMDIGSITKEDLAFNEKDRQQELDILKNLCLGNLEQWLSGGKEFLCGYDFTIADISFFNEVTNSLAVSGFTLDKGEFPNVSRWMSKIDDIGPIRKCSIEFQKEMEKIRAGA